jgi:hypothetical protein
VIEGVERLAGVDPKDFVATRNALVKELKASARAADAAAVAALRKPRLAEHGLNVVARDESELVAALIEATARASAAQAAAIRGDAADLRPATAALRAATDAVVDAAVAALGATGEAQRDAVVAVLRELSPDGLGLLRAGLTGMVEPGSDEAEALGLHVARPVTDVSEPPAGDVTVPAARKRTKPAARGTQAEDEAAAAGRLTVKQLRDLRAKEQRLERRVREADAAVGDADAAIRIAEAEIAKRQRRLAELQDERRNLQDDAARAAKKLAAVRAELDGG